MSNRRYFCICESDCLFETMTKEQILSAIAQAAGNGLVFDTDAAFITKVKESNRGNFLTFWVGTTAEYNAITTRDENCLYIITDDNAPAKVDEAVLAAQKANEDANAAAASAAHAAASVNAAAAAAIAGIVQGSEEIHTVYLNPGSPQKLTVTMGTATGYRTPIVSVNDGNAMISDEWRNVQYMVGTPYLDDDGNWAVNIAINYNGTPGFNPYFIVDYIKIPS